jgi:hypothetical protein
MENSVGSTLGGGEKNERGEKERELSDVVAWLDAR